MGKQHDCEVFHPGESGANMRNQLQYTGQAAFAANGYSDEFWLFICILGVQAHLARETQQQLCSCEHVHQQSVFSLA